MSTYSVNSMFGKSSGKDDDTFAYIETNGGDGVASSGAAQAVNGDLEPSRLPDPVRRDRVAMALLKMKAITITQVYEAYDLWDRQQSRDTFWRMLARHPKVDRDRVFGEAARTYAFPQESVDVEELDLDFVRGVIDPFPKDQQDRLLAFRLLPLRRVFDPVRQKEKIVFATHDPMRPQIMELADDLGLEAFELKYAPESVIAPLLDHLFPQRNEYMERIMEDEQAFDLGTTYEEKNKDLVNEDELEAEINRSALINLFEASLVEAVRMDASDIHIFPNPERQTEFHFRVDGALRLWHTQDKVHPEAMIAVVKDRCMNVDRFDREIAQDGYIQRTVDNKLIRYRVSVLPIASSDREVKAESIVIRVLDDRRVFTDLSQINLHPTSLKRFERAVRQPYGMIIMTGPTGSGKSTTLAAALHQVINPTVNVLTVEDPVEYIIQGARQIKLGTRLELQNALRSILRHDPDIVMVGEMRDRPTVELAIKLANTGHLTFSTLHTNDAPSAVSRLAKMDVEPFLIAYAINLIVAQRLLRKLCPACKEVDPDPDTILLRELGFSPNEIDRLTVYRAGRKPRCRICGGVGYKGRQAIAEALEFSRAIRHSIVEAGQTVDEDAIRHIAIEEGMLTLLDSAREVMKKGETTAEEVLRVVAT